MENFTKSERQELLVLLQTYDFDNAFKKIREILSKVSRVDYAPIIYGLVKIDILHQNKEYDYAIDYLDKVVKKDFQFGVSIFKRMMSQAEHQKNEQEYGFIREILENAKQLDLDIETKYEVFECIEEIEKKEEERKETDPARKSARRLVEHEHNRLLDGEEIVILDSRFNDKKDAILDICEGYPDIRAFVITDHKERERIVLRYKDPLYFRTDFSQKMKEGNQALKEKDYKKAREIFSFLLCHGKPKHYVYRALALCYAGLGEYRKALDFFAVTESMARDEGMNPRCAEVRNYVLEQYLNSETPTTRILEMINDACKEEGTSYNEVLEGLTYAKITVSNNTFLQIALYEPDIFQKIIETAREALSYKQQGKAYEKYSRPPKYRHITFNRFVSELRKSETAETRLERYNNYKPFVNLKSRELSYESDINLFGILNFDELDAYIKETGLDVETAAEEFGFRPNQINLIRLIYAREYFTQGYFEKGDEFLRSVEQDKDKDDYVKGMLASIREKKSFYRHRVTDNPRVLSLTLKPKRKKSDDE